MLDLTSDKDLLVSLLQDGINGNVLLVGGGKVAARFLVLSEVAPKRLLSRFFGELKYDLLVTVGRVRSEAGRVRGGIPRCFDGYFEVKVWTLDKQPVVDGDSLRELAYGEVKRVLQASSTQRIFSEREDDHTIGDRYVFCSIFTVIKITES